MQKIIVRRLLMMIPVLFGITLLVFTILYFAPGDPAQIILGADAKWSDVLALRTKLGLDDPFFVRYFSYIKNLLLGDMGTSWITSLPVFDEIASRMPTTLTLTFGSTLIMIIVGIPVGLISAVKRYSWIDNLSIVVSFLLTSMPSFWIGLILMLIFSLKLGWLPALGIGSIKHFILPCIALSSVQMAAIIRLTRSSMLDVLGQDYIRTARAKGANESRIIRKHAFRNAMMPVTTLVGLRIGSCMGGTLIIESVFALPGFGSLIIEAVKMRNIPVVMGGVIYIAVVVGIVNLLVDLLYTYIDPRVRV